MIDVVRWKLYVAISWLSPVKADASSSFLLPHCGIDGPLTGKGGVEPGVAT
jgi:hypothetical protein